MADITYKNIEITYDNGDISLCINNDLPSTFRFDDTSEDDSAPSNFRVEVNVAKIFHKVLNLIKTDPELFQKSDFELLGEMLGKILFGRINNKSDLWAANMRRFVNAFSSGNNMIRIFLNFNQQSKLAILPWEYTLYKSPYNTKPSRSWYISANTSSHFQLMRRTATNPTPQPVADKLFVIVLANVTGNENVVPTINSRLRDLPLLRKTFDSISTSLQTGSYPMIVRYLADDETKMNKVGEAIRNIYLQWQDEYGGKPQYVLHYIGHAIMQDEVGKLVVTDKNGDVNWMDDKTFASYFDSNVLDIPPPSLVCFQACDSAKIGVTQNELRGIAYQFTKLEIPAVIGMQNEINIPDSCAFFNKFYRQILLGKDVADAVTAGRDYLGREINSPQIYHRNSFGSPVLFITTEEPVTLLKPLPALQQQENKAEEKSPFSNKNNPSLKVKENRERAEVQPADVKAASDVLRTSAPSQSLSQDERASLPKNEIDRSNSAITSAPSN